MKDTGILTEPVLETSCQSCGHPLDVSGLPAFIEIACPECGTHQSVPGRLGGFLLTELMGKGGMGAVYRGLDTSLDRPVAVKVMLSSLGEDKEFVRTFRNEAQAAAALNHPNVVQIYSFGVEHGQPYMVMELLEGGRLDQMIGKPEPLSEGFALKVGADVAEGLNAAAAIGLIHGDVKPENILFDSAGVAKVVDFGLARFKKTGEPVVQGVWGTPYYIAPEKVRGHPADARSDIYSLGATLFHAIAGKPPFDGETPIDVVRARLQDPAPALRDVRPDTHPEVAAIIARMLEAEPMKRYPTYPSLLADLRRVLATVQPAPAPVPQVTRRGGKIVLVKKKGMRVAGPAAVPLAVHPAEMDTEEQQKRRRRRRKILWISIVSVLLAGLGIWGAVWGAMRHKALQAQRAEAARERAALDVYRRDVEEIWISFVGVATNAAGRLERAAPLVADAEQMKTRIVAAAMSLGDEGLNAGARTNAEAQAGIVGETVTGALQSAIAEFGGLTNGVATNRAAILLATQAVQAVSPYGAITGAVPRAKELVKVIEAASSRAQAAHSALQALDKRTASALEAKRAEDEKQAAVRAEEEKRAKEQAEKERLAREREELVQREIKQVEDKRRENAPLIQQHKYKEAADAVAALLSGLTTDEGRTAHKLALERYRMLVDLKKFIIAGIQAEARKSPDGFRYGWLSPSRDVLNADGEKIAIRGGTVPWEQVTPVQMLKFIKHYVESPDLDRVAAAQQGLAGAVYFVEAGAGNDKALKMASDLIGDASRLSPSIEAQARRILPEIGGK